MLEQAMEQHQAVTDTDPPSSLVASLGHVYLLAGRLDEAIRPARQALVLSRERQEHGTEAGILLLLGDITARQEPRNDEQAKSFYCQALDLATELDMRPLQAHCHRRLGTLYAAMGRLEQARAELSTAIDLYRPMDMTFWLPQVQAALAQIGGASLPATGSE
jgi:tetratricopeptide (TPR) repeat protein